MKLLISSCTDPYYNLATEEYLLKYCNEDFLFLYINQPSVVVGKHQVAQKEINSRYIFDNNILIARRLSGGGAVFHDHGNVNFSFICTTPPGDNISYKAITKPIVNFLEQSRLGIELSERNDIMVNGKKISGSAMHIYKNRTLAHATLLIDSDLNNLSLSLKGNPERYTDKSITSRRSKVMNLSEVDKNLTATTFITTLTSFLANKEGESYNITTLNGHNEIVNQLVSEKYSTIEWIYGYSPKYKYESEIGNGNKIIPYNIEVEKGIIKSVVLDSKDEVSETINLKMNMLKGANHNIFSILKLFSKYAKESQTAIIISSLF